MKLDKDKITIGSGLTFWHVAAGLLSWAQFKSLGWALFHAWCGPLYVLMWGIGACHSAPIVFP